MAVVMIFIKIQPESVQHGVLLVETAANPIIGRMYAVSYLQEDGHKDKTEPEKAELQ